MVRVRLTVRGSARVRLRVRFRVRVSFIVRVWVRKKRMCMNFMKCFREKRTCLLCKDKTLFLICQSIVRRENSLPSLEKLYFER